jgi:hypothetical protein
MRYKDILLETYVNVHDETGKSRYADEVHALIEKAYAYIGGHVNYPTPAALVEEDSWWKLVRRNGVITAVAIFKNKHGAKRVAIATDGSREAKGELRKIVADDIRMARGWAESSGAAANLCIKLGLPPVPNTFAAELLDKEILALHGKFKYDRLLGGMVHTKMIVGYPDGMRYEVSSDYEPSEVLF